MLNYEEDLPLAWRILEGGMASADPRQAEANERLLQQVLSAAGSHEDDADSSAQMRRLEMKLDRILDTLALIAHMQKLIPPTRAVRLSAEGVDWRLGPGESPPATGAMIGISLHLDRSSLQRLELRQRQSGPRRTGGFQPGSKVFPTPSKMPCPSLSSPCTGGVSPRPSPNPDPWEPVGLGTDLLRRWESGPFFRSFSSTSYGNFPQMIEKSASLSLLARNDRPNPAGS